MKKVGLIGFFNYGIEDIGGQVIKTRNYESVLKSRYGDKNVLCLDRLEGQNHPIRYIFHFIQMLCSVSTVILFPTKRMLKTFIPIIRFFQSVFHYKIIYVVIGGWLPTAAAEDSSLQNILKRIDIIYAETKEMASALKRMGLVNVDYIPNFSMRKSLEQTEFENIELDNQTFRLCTYSRVTKEKGVLNAIEAVHQVNAQAGSIICTLDVFGQVWPDFENEFNNAVAKYPAEIEYKGIIKGDEALREIASHHILLFPTYYEGEGFPGTLVEALMAGVPVIASDWHYNADIIKNGYSGIIYSLDNKRGLCDSIRTMISDKEQMKQFRENAYKESFQYLPEKLLDGLFKAIE